MIYNVASSSTRRLLTLNGVIDALSMSIGTCSAPGPETDSQTTPNLGNHAKWFRKNWQAASADNAIALYGFRRFKTTHLLNLRFLEDEIAELDHIIYQAGLTLGVEHAPANKLGLSYCKRDANTPAIDTTITEALVLKLRGLLKQYGASSMCLFAYSFLSFSWLKSKPKLTK